MSKAKTLKLETLTSREGRPVRANIMAKMIQELDAFEFGTVEESLNALKSTEGVPPGTFGSYSKATQIRERRFEVAHKRYVYGSKETIDALRAGEDKSA